MAQSVDPLLACCVASRPVVAIVIALIFIIVSGSHAFPLGVIIPALVVDKTILCFQLQGADAVCVSS